MAHNVEDKDIFDQVLTIGPDIKAPGGIAAVINSYRPILKPFHYRCTNSQRGTIAGMLPLLKVLACLPIDRIRGRKILHIHSASGKSFIRKSIIVCLGKLLGFKIILHCHGGKLPTFFQKIGMSKAAKIINKCDALIVLTPNWKNYYESTFKHPRVRIVNNYVQPFSNSVLNLDKDPLRLVFLGVINHEKGIFDLVNVFDKNKQKWQGRVSLKICGIGPEFDQLQEYIQKKHLGNLIEYRGYVSGQEKTDIICNSDVVVLPSYFEAQPVCILEGMAAGKGIISTKVGGIPDMVTDCENGQLIQPGDLTALTSAIDRYLDDRTLLLSHAQKAKERSKEYSFENTASRLKDLYQELTTL